jgi:CRP/FNR family transcriptional regulator, cyclic AMP receptor protein
MTWIEAIGYAAAVSTFAAFWMKTMIPLRAAGITANCFFIAYGYFGGLYPPLILHLVLLPLNVVRLYQMQQLVKKVAEASSGDLSVEWLKPFMLARSCRAGEVIFRKGDMADEMLYTVTGRYRVTELALDIGPGQVIGEIGLVVPEHRRTQTIECIEDGEVLSIGYNQVKQLYFQNPKFGFYLLRLIGERLSHNVAVMEGHQLSSVRASSSTV